MYLPTREKFIGKCHWVDEVVAKKIVNREADALHDIPDPPSTIMSYFRPTNRKGNKRRITSNIAPKASGAEGKRKRKDKDDDSSSESESDSESGDGDSGSGSGSEEEDGSDNEEGETEEEQDDDGDDEDQNNKRRKSGEDDE